MGIPGVGNGRSKGLFRKNRLFFSHWSTGAGREPSKMRQERPADAGTEEPCGKQEMPLDLAQSNSPKSPRLGWVLGRTQKLPGESGGRTAGQWCAGKVLNNQL